MGAIRDWATPGNLQPEPITVEIWRDLPEEFCRQVEVVNGQAVRCEAPRRTHQAAARRLATVLESAAADYMALHPGSCLDVSNDFDVILWEVPTATIRRPDLALHNCAPDDVRPLPASYIRVIIEVVSPGSDKTDRVEKMGEYATAGIPFYWLVWITDNQVASIDVYVLDHAWCGAHGLRDLAGLYRFDPDGQLWARPMADLLIDANARAGAARRAGQPALSDADLTAVRAWYRGAVAKGIVDNQGKRTQIALDGARLARRFRDHEDMILRFATDLAVGFTSNQAERDVRPVKVQQRTSGGTWRTLQGLAGFAVVQSYLSTTAKWGIDALDALTMLFTSGPWLPPAAAPP